MDEAAHPVRAFAYLRSCLAPHRRAFGLLALVVALGIALQLAAPFAVREYVDGAASDSSTFLEDAVPLALGFLVLSLLGQAVFVLEIGLAQRVAWTVTNELRVSLTRRCVQADLGQVSRRRVGEWVERIDGDANLLSNFFSKFLASIVAQSFLIAGILLCVTWVDWRTGLTLTVIAGGTVALIAALTQKGRRAFLRFRSASTALSSTLGQYVPAVAELRCSGAEDHAGREVAERVAEVNRAEVRASLWGDTVLWAAAAFGTWLGTTAALAWAGWLFWSGQVTLGTAFLIFSLTQQLIGPLNQMAYELQDLQAAHAAFARIAALDASMPERHGAGGQAWLPMPQEPDVVFRGVDFRYAGAATEAVSDVELRVPGGRCVALVGTTGSGKSTIAKLAAGLVRPTSGQVTWAGTPLELLGTEQRCAMSAVVLQDVDIFHASLYDNVTVFDASVPREEVAGAFARLGLTDWLAALPDGMDTVLGASGHGLSDGEQQLVALSRVLIHDPRVLVLDEVSARLDPVTEARVVRGLAEVVPGRTCLLVTHRAATVDLADETFVVSDGRLHTAGRTRGLAPTSGAKEGAP